MFDTATVTTRPFACWVAVIFPAESISAMSQPPKMSPIGLVSAGIARVRLASPPRGAAAASPGGTAGTVPCRSMATRASPAAPFIPVTRGATAGAARHRLRAATPARGNPPARR
jgi:hypothetical protein